VLTGERECAMESVLCIESPKGVRSSTGKGSGNPLYEEWKFFPYSPFTEAGRMSKDAKRDVTERTENIAGDLDTRGGKGQCADCWEQRERTGESPHLNGNLLPEGGTVDNEVRLGLGGASFYVFGCLLTRKG